MRIYLKLSQQCGAHRVNGAIGHILIPHLFPFTLALEVTGQRWGGL